MSLSNYSGFLSFGRDAGEKELGTFTNGSIDCSLPRETVIVKVSELVASGSQSLHSVRKRADKRTNLKKYDLEVDYRLNRVTEKRGDR